MNQQATDLAPSITKAASKQTYYTFRYLADRQRVPDAYRAYAYFRWVDDQVDQVNLQNPAGIAFMDRQKWIMDNCYQGHPPDELTPEEQMLAGLIDHDQEENSGLQSYLRNMMAVIDFDARRRGRLISQLELSWYSQSLAVAVTDALTYFIGHDHPSPQSGARYLAVAGAHVTHMLRDTLEDIQAGYFNITREYLAANGIGPWDVDSHPYRAWVRERANLARAYFGSGKVYLAQDKNVRRRIAGYAYITRFERVLNVIERQDYQLAREYPQALRLNAGMKLSRWALFVLMSEFFRNLMRGMS